MYIKAMKDWLRLYTRFMELVKNVPSQHSLPPEVFGTILNLYGFKQINFVAACTDGLHISVSYDNKLKIFPVNVYSRAPLSSNVSSERAHRICPHFFFQKEP
jgi:hypothetical protein